MPALENRQILLRRRPTGLVQPEDTELVSTPAPEPAEGEALLRTTYVGLDAAARTWLNDQPGYLPPVQIGEVIRAAGIGEVVETRCDAFKVGDVVTTLTGFQDYSIIRDDVFATPVTPGSDQLAVMSMYGPTGATAYMGMTDIGRPQAGETVVVSAAAGATGSVAGQIAKIAGARVVGMGETEAVVTEVKAGAGVETRVETIERPQEKTVELVSAIPKDMMPYISAIFAERDRIRDTIVRPDRTLDPDNVITVQFYDAIDKDKALPWWPTLHALILPYAIESVRHAIANKPSEGTLHD